MWFRRSLLDAFIGRELELFPNDVERKSARKSARKVVNRWYYHFGMVVVIPLFVWLSRRVAGQCVPLLPFTAGWLRTVFEVATYAVLYLFAAGAYFWLIRGVLQRHVRTRLIELGVPVCLHCGYDLRGQTEPRCPECGREFDPAILHKASGPASQPDSTTTAEGHGRTGRE